MPPTPATTRTQSSSSAYAISNLANGKLVSETMPVAPNASFPVSAYLHGEMDSMGSEGNWQINACFYKYDGAPSSCSILASGSAPATNWTQVSGTVTSPADAATMKLELVGAQLSGWLAWDDVSVSLDTQMITKYYYAGSQRVAVRKNGVLNYLLNDHLGSASVVTDAGGSLLSKMLYKPWGETRYTSGVMPTDRLYTGQIAEPNLGLYFYNARWYDPLLSRFSSADTIIPQPGNPQSWDRYSYVNNSPLMYTDPSGHQAWDGCSGENGGCAGGSNYKDYVFNYLHTDQERQENQEDLDKVVNTVTTIIGVVNEPADWMMTAAYCAAGECSPWVLVGLLPFIPGSAGRKLNEVIALLPAPKIHNHHIFPQQFRKRFEKAGIEIEKHTIELSEGLHLRGVHGKGGFVGPGNKVIPNDRWNILWSDFFNDNPNPSAKEIYQFAGQLMDTFGLSGLPIVPYK